MMGYLGSNWNFWENIPVSHTLVTKGITKDIKERKHKEVDAHCPRLGF